MPPWRQVSEFYQSRGHHEELIGLLESGIGLERAHMGIFTELGVLYAKYRPVGWPVGLGSVYVVVVGVHAGGCLAVPSPLPACLLCMCRSCTWCLFASSLTCSLCLLQEKLMEHLKLFATRLNVPQLIRVCEELELWRELTFLCAL